MYICLTGKAGSGKDTAADAIMGAYSDFTRYALAGPIKELAEAWLGINPDYLQRGVKESLVAFEIGTEMFECLDIIIYDMFKDRHDAITMPMAKKVAKVIFNCVMKDNMYSNVAHEEIHPDMLVTTPRRILQIIGTEGFRDTVCDTFWLDICPKGDVVITDVRFNNEGEWFDAFKDTLMIETIRPNKDISLAAAVHISEQAINFELVDHQIVNDGSISDLQEAILHRVCSHLENINGEW